MQKHITGFMDFIREQGVVGLAIGFVLGGAVAKLVTALVADIINPIVGLLLGNTKGLESAVISIGDARLQVGDFISVLIDFAIIALVVYLTVKVLGFDKLDKEKEK